MHTLRDTHLGQTVVRHSKKTESKLKLIELKKIDELQLFDGDIPTKEGQTHYERDYVVKPDINPYLVYITLKELFGNPNSDSFDEDKVQWAWQFKYEDFFIEIYDWKLFSTSIAIYHQSSDKDKSKKIGDKINELLTKNAVQKKSRIKTIIKESKHKILENPFVTYYSTAQGLLKTAKLVDEIDSKNASLAFEKIFDENNQDVIVDFDFMDRSADLYRSAFLMFFSSFEGFLNILYELYLKSELRADRLYERIAREQIDVKLRIAPIYCDGFKTKTINNEDIRFKNYLRLVNLRNDYVHANLIKSLERYIVSEDNHTFIFENEENTDIPSNISNLELKHVELAKKYIDDIVELVIESLEPKTKREFKKIIFEREIEVEDEDGVLIPT